MLRDISTSVFKNRRHSPTSVLLAGISVHPCGQIFIQTRAMPEGWWSNKTGTGVSGSLESLLILERSPPDLKERETNRSQPCLRCCYLGTLLHAAISNIDQYTGLPFIETQIVRGIWDFRINLIQCFLTFLESRIF